MHKIHTDIEAFRQISPNFEITTQNHRSYTQPKHCRNMLQARPMIYFVMPISFFVPIYKPDLPCFSVMPILLLVTDMEYASLIQIVTFLICFMAIV